MDSESLPLPSFDLHPSTWSIDRVVLFAEAGGAESFLAHIFPHYHNCLVASADRLYPLDPVLNTEVFGALESNPSLRVIIFNAGALKKVKVKSERIFLMDDLVMQDFKRQPYEAAPKLQLDAEKIIFLIDSFFSQWDKLNRTGNVDFAYKNFSEYNFDPADWKLGLLISSGEQG